MYEFKSVYNNKIWKSSCQNYRNENDAPVHVTNLATGIPIYSVVTGTAFTSPLSAYLKL